MSGDKPVQQVANAVRDELVRHIPADTTEADAQREAERDARVRAVIDALGREGKLPSSLTPAALPGSADGFDPAVTP
jgi:hypothetical protein